MHRLWPHKDLDPDRLGELPNAIMTMTKAQQDFLSEFLDQARSQGHDEIRINEWITILSSFGILAPGIPSWKVNAHRRTIRVSLAKLT